MSAVSCKEKIREPADCPGSPKPGLILLKEGVIMKLTVKECITVALFTALMVAGAYLRIPFPLLPVTLQTFICALSGLVLGARLGALSMTVYMCLGLAGLPIFASGGGPASVFEKSFGFIIGFIAGAYVIGRISARFEKPTPVNNLKALLPGLISIYIPGIVHMLLIMRIYLGNKQAGLLVVLSGNLPYFIKDVFLFVIIAFSGASLLPVVRKALYNKAS